MTISCKKCTKEFKVTFTEITRGRKYCSWECCGIHELRPYEHLKKWEYRFWRTEIFKRDNYTCQECKIRSCKGISVQLEAHHIKSWKDYPESRYDINNGITLCKSCHFKTPTYGGRNKILSKETNICVLA